MNDETRVFIEDIQEKNKTKASHIISPAKPVDYESKAGEVRAINPKKPITYAEFKKLDARQQKMYLQAVCDDWRIGAGGFAKMWALDIHTAANIISRRGIKTVDRWESRRNMERFCAEFICGVKLAQNPVEEVKPPIDLTPEQSKAVTVDCECNNQKANSIAEAIRLLVNAGASLDIHIRLDGDTDDR